MVARRPTAFGADRKHQLTPCVFLDHIHSKAGQPAIRVLVRAAKASRVPLALLPGLVLNDSAGVPTAQAESVLRGGGVLPLGQIR